MYFKSGSASMVSRLRGVFYFGVSGNIVFKLLILPDWEATFVNEGPLSWVASQADKPGRPTTPAWVLHANPDWSSRFLEHEPDEVCDLLIEAARKLPIAQEFSVEFSVAHRWRYALARQPLDCGALFFESKQLALAGDWCHGSRVEGAFLSGIAAAGLVG
jgi:renalase